MTDATGLDALDRQLADAIEDGRLRAVLADLSAGASDVGGAAGERLSAARGALAAIDGAVGAETARLLDALRAAAVGGAAERDGTGGRPLHLVTLRVERGGADRARAVLGAAGYDWLGPAHASAWRAHRASHGSAAFRRDGDPPFRVELTWPRARVAATRAGRLLAPHAADLDAVVLPRALWPLYGPVRMALLVRRIVRRRPGPPDLGPFLETPDALIAPLLTFAAVGPDDVLVDLGCGDGRIVVEAARRTGCRARGIELDADLTARARAAVTAAGLHDRVEIVHGDASNSPLTDATVIVVFLPVRTVETMLPGLLAQLSPGARLVAHEQERLRTAWAPDDRRPLLTAGGITVARRWNR